MTFKESKFEKADYEGSSPSTLCLGCGHDQISKHIVKAFCSAGVDPFSIAKLSGIGCSSKTPNYFLKRARGFNTIHGRMACVATGVKIANPDLIVLGISGDGDTGSIGLGSFLHSIRKNIPMIYIVENNGVYGLTKGQFSATAQKNTRLKNRENNSLESMDLCSLALSAGCGFIARSFSGDSKQMSALLKLAIQYKGFAFIDVISPCVAYGNEKDFPHSFRFMKDRQWPLNEIDLIFDSSKETSKDTPKGNLKRDSIPNKNPASNIPDTDLSSSNIPDTDLSTPTLSATNPSDTEPLDTKPQTNNESFVISIPLPSGGFLKLKKLVNHDPSKKTEAEKVLNQTQDTKKVLTGLIYYQKKENFLNQINISQTPLVKTKKLSPDSKNLTQILNHYT